MIKTLKRLFVRRKNQDEQLARYLAIEVESRFGKYYRGNGRINFLEFFNDCFQVIEGMRSGLRQFPESSDQNIGVVIGIIREIYDVLDAWHLSYATWYGGFKTHAKQFRELGQSGRSHLFYDVQTFFPKAAEVEEDIRSLVEFIESEIDTMAKEASKNK